MRRLFPLLAISSGLLACSPTGDTHTACEDAAAVIEECTGEAPALECTGELADYEKILDTYEAEGCSALAGGKGDDFLCRLLSVFGWCDGSGPEPLGPVPSGDPTRHPMILAHGFNTSTTNFWRFNDVDIELAGDGHDVILGSVPPFDTPQVRAEHLEDQLDGLLAAGAEKVNLVCFSMGGLDCRYLASPGGLDRGADIASITTISSPHRGSGMADAATGILPGADRAKVVDALASLWGMTFSDLAEDSHVVAALESMAEANIGEFNAATPDAPGVFYQSWAGFSHVAGLSFGEIERAIRRACTVDGELRMMRHDGTRDAMDALLWSSAAFVGHFNPLRPGDALPNDGVTTIESARWGEFRGCFPADHLDQAGQINDDGSDRDTGFDYLRFYRNLAYDLAARGF
jgi:triacylglycerol lipase